MGHPSLSEDESLFSYPKPEYVFVYLELVLCWLAYLTLLSEVTAFTILVSGREAVLFRSSVNNRA